MSIRYRSFGPPIVKLKRCPCSKWPDRVIIQGKAPSKWMSVGGDCCGIWFVDFEADDIEDKEELMVKAISAWNCAPRTVYETRREKLKRK